MQSIIFWTVFAFWDIQNTANTNVWRSGKSLPFVFPSPTLHVPPWAGLALHGVTALPNPTPCTQTLLFLTCTLIRELLLLPGLQSLPGGERTKLISFGHRNPLCLWHLSLYAQRKSSSEAELLHLRDPVENISHQAGLEVIAELNSANTCFKRDQLGGFFLSFQKPLWGLICLYWLSWVMCRRDELSVLSFGDGLKASLHLASPLHRPLQIKWAENFPHFLFFLPFHSFCPSLCLLSFNYEENFNYSENASGIFRGKWFWVFFQQQNNSAEIIFPFFVVVQKLFFFMEKVKIKTV